MQIVRLMCFTAQPMTTAEAAREQGITYGALYEREKRKRIKRLVNT